MPLTSSDTFTSVRFTLTFDGYKITINYRLSDGSHDRIEFLGGDLPGGHSQQADLDVLREIYASADGFRDAGRERCCYWRVNDFAQ